MAKRNPAHPQDWRFLMVLFATSTFLELTAWGHMLAFAPLYMKNELGVPPEDIPRWAGILASSSLVIAVPLSPFWGVLADRYSRKAVIIRSQLIEAVAYALAAVCGDVWQLLWIRLLIGLCYGNMAVTIATQSIVTPNRRVATAIGIIQMAATAAAATGPIVGSLIINAVGMRALFALDSVLVLVASSLLLLFFREPSEHDRTTPMVSKLKLVFGQVAHVPPIRWNFLCWFLIWAGAAAMDTYLPVQIDRLYGAADSALVIGVLLASYGFLTALGTPLAGWIAGRIGAAPVFLVAAPLLALIAGGVGLVWTLPALAILVILRAGPQAATAVVLYSHLAAHVPVRYRASVMSLTPLPRNSAWLVGPAVGAVASGFGLPAVFYFAAALFGCASLSALLMLRASRGAVEPAVARGRPAEEA